MADSRDSGTLLLDHIEQYLGPFTDASVHRSEALPDGFQVLKFGPVFQGCQALVTFGISRYSEWLGGRPVEVVCTVDSDAEQVEGYLVATLLGAIHARIPLAPFISLGGLEQRASEFVRRTGKSGFYFCQPPLLPEAFYVPPLLPGTRILMAIPITTAERRLNEGSVATELEDIWERQAIDPFWLRRPSAV